MRRANLRPGPCISAVALLGLLLTPAALAQQEQALSLGIYQSRGTYGDSTETEILYLPISYEHSIGNWGFQLVLPWLQVEGPGNVLVNVGGVTRAVAASGKSTQKGAGDVTASAIYHLEPSGPAALFIDLRLDIKLPTANERKGLGTGETDLSAQMDLSKVFGNKVVFATLGRNFRGKTRLYEGLRDSSFLQLGIAASLSERWNGGIFYDYREAASTYSRESHELVPYATWQINPRWSFTALLTRGFTDGSADYSVMGQLSYRW